MSLDDHAEDLASDLGVDKEEVKNDLENLVNYSVPVEEAKQSLRRKYGDGGGGDATPQATDVGSITVEDGSVTVTAVVLTVGKRSIHYQGEETVIYEGELADETGRIDYTAWEDFGLEPGDAVTVGNANVREWEGKPELNLGEGTSVGEPDEAPDVPHEIGGDADLIDLEPGDRGTNVEVEVVEVERKTIDGRDGETDILSGVVGDETARLPVTDWDPHEELEEGATVRIENVYVREYRGAPSINVSKFSTIEPIDEVDVRASAPRMSIGEAVSSGGAFDVELVGNLIEVRDGSGLIQRCPDCNRVIQRGQCRTHGDVEGVDDLRVKAILDDGTGTATAILDEEVTAEIYGGGVEKAREAAREAMDQEVVADAIRERIVGREYRIRGQLSVDDYGANLDATEFEEVEESPTDRAREFLAEVGT